MYKRHRFPPEIVQHLVWLYHRFNLSSRDIEDLVAERGIGISYESIRLWCIKFGPMYAKRLRCRHQGFGDTFFIDEVFVKIQGRQHYRVFRARSLPLGYNVPLRLGIVRQPHESRVFGKLYEPRS